MKILEIAPYKGSTMAVTVEDCEQTFYFHKSLIADFGLQRGMELSEAQLTEIQNAALFRRAYERALYLLDARAHTHFELRQKLRRNYPEVVCERVIHRLDELHMLNDAACAEALARTYVELKKYGVYRAKQELHRRGLSDTLIAAALAPYREDGADRLVEVIEKKYARRLTDPSDRAEIEKVKAALARRGYGYTDIKEAMAAYFASQAEEYDEEDWE